MPVHINIAESAVFKSAFESELVELHQKIEEERREKEQERKEKMQERREKMQERREKEKALTALHNSIRSLLKHSSLSVQEIATSLNVNIELVLKIKEELNR